MIVDNLQDVMWFKILFSFFKNKFFTSSYVVSVDRFICIAVNDKVEDGVSDHGVF